MCYSACTHDPPLKRSSLQEGFSGTSYSLVNYITCSKFFATYKAFLAPIAKIIKPKYYHEAARDPRCRQTMTEEIKALETNHTYTIEDLPPGEKLINCKWVYKVKYKSDGTIKRFKARLVVRGDHQIEGFDSNKIFVLVAKVTSVRAFLLVAVARGWELH